MQLKLTKQDAKYLYFEWTPPEGAEWYLLYVDKVLVSTHTPKAFQSTRFSKGSKLYEIVAVVRTAQGFSVDVGSYSPSSGTARSVIVTQAGMETL